MWGTALANVFRPVRAVLSVAFASSGKPYQTYLIWVLVCSPLGYLYTERSSRSHYVVPQSIEEAQVVTGVLQEKRRNKHSYRLTVGDMTLRFGCAPNSIVAMSCPPRDVYNTLVGKTATVYFMEYDRAFKFRRSIVAMTVDGKTVVDFDETRSALLRAKAGDQSNKGGAGLVIGLFWGLATAWWVLHGARLKARRERSSPLETA